MKMKAILSFGCFVTGLWATVAPLPTSAAEPSTVTLGGKDYPVARSLPEGADILGDYVDIDDGAVMNRLNADHTGEWRGDKHDPFTPIKWYIVGDSKGSPLLETFPAGKGGTLVIEFRGELSGFQLALTNDGKVYINGDRVHR